VPSLRTRVLVTVSLGVAGALAALPASALAGSGGVTVAGPGAPAPVPGVKAKLLRSGVAAAPEGAPEEVVRAIEAANSIDGAGYCTGGGHKLGWRRSRCYDCSGAVSYVLGPKGADILDSPLPSGDLEKWGYRGKGGWISVYANGGHAFVVIAGLRFDTSIPDDGEEGPGWSKDVKAGLVNGPFKIRHSAGL
jgi:hypothetical protein